jgi:hypothetical protein
MMKKRMLLNRIQMYNTSIFLLLLGAAKYLHLLQLFWHGVWLWLGSILM